MPGSFTLVMSVDDKRRSECLRKRKYRAAKRTEVKLLEDQVAYLEQKLERIQLGGRRKEKRLDPTALAARVLHKYTTSLREQVENREKLARILSSWVESQRPQPGPSMKASWMRPTLIAHPEARRCAMEWLCNRVYHSALRAFPRNPFGNHAEDAMTLIVHRGEDDEGVTIAALETHFQFTIFSDLAHVASESWKSLIESNDIFTNEVVEHIQENLVYFVHTNHRLHTSTRLLSGLFHEPQRAVLAHTMLSQDECFPLQENELRPHGFGWTVLEAVTDSMTLVRSCSLQFTPERRDGVISLEQVGQIFGVSAEGIENRERYIDRIHTAAETAYIQTNQPINRCFSECVEKSSSKF